ncbi:hypothetical protein [Paenibacillus kobensis]|uniref:hypothetical protein n=1 Tax=Paenibacillus kobensis TaxID=59841 RepID=UPI000FD75178|nr:hypothetical protein [Paenibacillus kobensis]
MPNHSSIEREEAIDLPIGKCQLITLDADNGPAASGLTGTHNVYYAIISVNEEVIYMFNLTWNDKAEETKDLFIGLLNKLSLKVASK